MILSLLQFDTAAEKDESEKNIEEAKHSRPSIFKFPMLLHFPNQRTRSQNRSICFFQMAH